MHERAAPSASPSARRTASTSTTEPDNVTTQQDNVTTEPAGVWYSYAIVRVVPRVERGECVNVGVVLFSRERRHLAASMDLDRARLRALAPDLDLALVERHLTTFLVVADGQPEGGPVADLPPAERFHWLTAPRSTIIQTSPTHVGRTSDLAAELDRLLDAYVRPPQQAGHSP
jgi:hypothetical protein